MKITTNLNEATISNVADYAAAEGLSFDAAYEKLLSLAITFTRIDEGHPFVVDARDLLASAVAAARATI